MKTMKQNRNTAGWLMTAAGLAFAGGAGGCGSMIGADRDNEGNQHLLRGLRYDLYAAGAVVRSEDVSVPGKVLVVGLLTIDVPISTAFEVATAPFHVWTRIYRIEKDVRSAERRAALNRREDQRAVDGGDSTPPPDLLCGDGPDETKSPAD